MAAKGTLKTFSIATAAETRKTKAHLETPPQTLTEDRQEQSRFIQKVASEGSIADMLEAEKIFLTFELDIAHHPLQRSSIEAALTQVEAAMDTLDMLLHSPEEYRGLNRGMSHERNRIGPHPRDQVRQFCKSEHTRLQNLTKGRLSKEELGLLSDRSYLLKTLEGQYIEKQQEFLETTGQGASKSKDRGR